MKFSDYNNKHVLIGVVAASLPFIALGIKFGALKGLLIFGLVVARILIARFTVYLFTRSSKVASGGAVAMQWNLLFLLFLPKHLREEMQKLEEREKQTKE